MDEKMRSVLKKTDDGVRQTAKTVSRKFLDFSRNVVTFSKKARASQGTTVKRVPALKFSTRFFSSACVSVLILFGALFTFEIIKSLTRTSFTKLPSLKQQAEGLSVFDRNDKLVCVVQQGENKEPISIDRMSPNIRNAMIAAEDHNFYKHFGLDLFGIARATMTNIKAGRIVEGGSSITQQLAKVMFSDAEDRTLQRKAYEALIAIDLESGYSKNKILETYLNLVYFGNGAYGIEKASQTYFHKHANALTPAEAAFLAGLVKDCAGIRRRRATHSARRNRACKTGFLREDSWLRQELVLVSGSH